MTNIQILREIQSKLSSVSEKEYFSIHVDRYRFVLDQIQKLNLLANHPMALDIGCYPPHLLSALKLLGFDTFGISSSHEQVDSKQVKTANLETDALPFQTNSFDLIIFTEVLEHLVNHPDLVFRELHRLLKPGGSLILTTPNVCRSQNIVSLLSGHNIYFPLSQMKSTSSHDDSIYHRHNREYTLSELELLAQSHHFTISRSGRFIAYSPNRAKNQSDSFSLKIIKRLNYLIMTTLPYFKDSLYLILTK